jgi:adenylate cyclase
MPIVPRDVKKAVELLKVDPLRERTTDELAKVCGVAERTLQKHFRRFVGRTPSQIRRDLCLDQVRRELLRARPETTITATAARFGFNHLARFAAAYRQRYGETPSATLRRRKQTLAPLQGLPIILSPVLDRPVVTVHPFEMIGPRSAGASRISDEISAALLRNRWLAIGAPAYALYHLRGKVRHDGQRLLRVTAMLTFAPTGRHIWADRWDGELDDVFTFEDRVATRVAAAVERALRVAEVERVSQKDPAQLGAWELTMRALPRAMRLHPAALTEAIELLERAMELAPSDALPVALAAWCHGQRATHHFTRQPAVEKQAGRELTARATRLNACDPTVDALLAASETLAENFSAAAAYCERALALDGGCTWAWNRKGLLHAYMGRPADAIECLQIARSLGPEDPMAYCCSVGIGFAHFEVGRYGEALRWWTSVLAERPWAHWLNRYRAAALTLAGKKEEARESLAALVAAHPDLTLTDVTAALPPHTQGFRDRACEAITSLGMRV